MTAKAEKATKKLSKKKTPPTQTAMKAPKAEQRDKKQMKKAKKPAPQADAVQAKENVKKKVKKPAQADARAKENMKKAAKRPPADADADADSDSPSKKKKKDVQDKLSDLSEEPGAPNPRHQKAKQLRLERREKKAESSEVFQLGQRAKQLWEKVRRDDCPEKEREQLLNELWTCVKGRVKPLIYAHDTVRVIECLMALGAEAVRQGLFEEMREELVSLAKSKYANFFVHKVVRYGTKEQRQALFQQFNGKVAELMKHKTANNVVELYYNDHANAKERNSMLQEFCGPEFRHFKEPELRTVAELIERHPEKKKDIVRHLGQYVGSLINKGCYNHSLVHTVIYNYLQVCSAQERSDTVSLLREVCVHVLHSPDGARLSMMAVWHGTNKDRKSIMKSFKTFVKKICCEEHGYLVLLALFDTVDDTKVLSKIILDELVENMEEIAQSEHGRRVLMYLVGWRDTTYMHPQILAILRQGDGNEHSKKDAPVRAQELRAHVSPTLVKFAVQNMSEMLYDNSAIIFLTCLLKHSSGAEPALAQLAEEACKPFNKGDDEPNIVETTGSHMMLKKLIAHDVARRERDDKETLFCDLLLKALDDDSLESWVRCNRGAFLLVKMMETNIESVIQGIKDKIKSVKTVLKMEKTAGAELLKKKLQ